MTKQVEDVRFYSTTPTDWLFLPRPLRLLLGWMSVTLFACTFYFVPFSLLSLVFASYYQGNLLDSLYWLAPCVAMLLLLSRFPGNTEWPWFRKLFQLWYEIFDFKVNTSPDRIRELGERGSPETPHKVIFAMHPHGIVPIQAGLWAGFCGQYLPRTYGFGAVATVAMRLPILRAILGWLTCMPADYDSLLQGLYGNCPPANRAGRKTKNLFILPGGVAEVFTSAPGKDVIVYQNRRGLCRLSLQTGAVIVPGYVFGGTGFFHNFATGDGFLSRMSRKLRAGLTLFWGQWLLPIPLSVPVRLAIGRPLELEGPQDVTEEAVEALHRRYIKEITRLFETHKVAAGYPDATLEIR